MRFSTTGQVVVMGVLVLAAAGCTPLGITAKVPSLTARVGKSPAINGGRVVLSGINFAGTTSYDVKAYLGSDPARKIGTIATLPDGTIAVTNLDYTCAGAAEGILNVTVNTTSGATQSWATTTDQPTCSP
jgi:hypothetical protein